MDNEKLPLALKFARGKKAAARYDRMRRIPPLVVGGLLFVVGSLMFVPLNLELINAERWYATIGVIILEPGGTILLLALLPDDEWIIDKLYMALLFVDSSVALTLSFPALSVLRGSDFAGVCVDYEGADVPCWCAAMQVANFLLLGAQSFYLGVFLNFREWWYRIDPKGRMELLWRQWGLWLVGWALINTMLFVVPYVFFGSGRAYLISPAGLLYIYSCIAALPFAYVSLSDLHTQAQDALAKFATVTNAMAIAVLMSPGDESFSELMARGKRNLRYVEMSSMELCHWDSHAASMVKYTLSVRSDMYETDFFVSHSWHDNHVLKYNALADVVESFTTQHGRQPKLWVDIYCINQSNIAEDLKLLPVFLMATNKILMLVGPTYFSRLWCCMELFVFVESGGTPSRIQLVPICGYTPRAEDFDFSKCQCSVSADMTAMMKVVHAGCGGVENFNARVRAIINEVLS